MFTPHSRRPSCPQRSCFFDKQIPRAVATSTLMQTNSAWVFSITCCVLHLRFVWRLREVSEGQAGNTEWQCLVDCSERHDRRVIRPPNRIPKRRKTRRAYTDTHADAHPQVRNTLFDLYYRQNLYIKTFPKM